jgi:YegS/Rv2252/BmrU family lipid kinase
VATLIQRVLLVINPASRRGLKRRPVALREFQRAGVTVEELVTGHPGHARDRLRAGAPTVDAVFVLGGDGAVMEVAGALSGTGVPIGVLPGGTGNLVAGTLGVPRSVRRAVPGLLAGRPRPFDLGRMGDHYFAFAAGLGIDVDMVLGTTASRKRTLGILAYVLSAARSALRRRTYLVTADVDGRVITARVILAIVANSGTVLGGRLLLGPDLRPDDGELDLCLFTPTTVGQVLGVTWRALRRDFRDHPHMQFVRGKRIRLSSEPVTTVQADGDLAGQTPVEITVMPGAARFLVTQG